MSGFYRWIRDLFGELQRRRVYSVVAVYLATAFVLIQVADLTFEHLFLPTWSVTLLIVLVILGLPAAIILAWAYELTPEGVQRADTAEIREERDPAEPSTRRSRALWLIVALGVLLGAVYFVKQEDAGSFAPRDWIVLADCGNQTDQDILDGTLRAALTIALHQSSYLNVFPDARVQETLRRMGNREDRALNETLAREVAERANLRAVLTCNVAHLGEAYVISARLIDPAGGETLGAFEVRARDRSYILGALDKLSRRIREFAGEGLGRALANQIPLPQATTASLGALKNFAEAERAEREGRGQEKLALLQEAVELDSTFALAHAELGAYYYWENDRPAGERHFQRALAHLDGVTDRERLWILAQIAAFRGQREEAVHRYRAFLRRWKDDEAGWSSLGHTLLMLDRCKESIDAYRRVLEIDPGEAAAHLNIATCYNKENRFEEALAHYRLAFDLQPSYRTDGSLNHEFGAVYVQTGRYAEASEIFREMLASDEGWEVARAHRSFGLLDRRRGALASAVGHLREAALLNRKTGKRLSEIRDRLFLTSVHHERGDGDAVDRELRAVAELRETAYVEPFFLQVEARLRLLRGDPEGARGLLALVRERANSDNVSDQASLALLQGEIALEEGEPATALEHFALAHTYQPNGLSLEAFGRVLRRLGDLEGAAARYEALIADPEWGWEAAEHWVCSHFVLGTLYQAMGEPDRAAAYYRAFLSLWDEADHDLPRLAEARTRLAALDTADGEES